MKVISIEYDAPGVRDTWHQLFDAADPTTTTFFQSWEWNVAWWNVYGARDRKRKNWLVRVDDGENPVGIGPFFWQRRAFGRKRMWEHLLWNGHELSPYPDVICAGASRERMWDTLIRTACGRPGVRWLELRDIGESHPLMHWHADGFRVYKEEHEPVLHWDIPAEPGEGDSVLERVRPQFRRNIKKALRTFEAHGGLTWRFSTGVNAEAMQALIELNLMRFHRNSFFTNPSNGVFYRRLAMLAPEKLFFATVSEAGRIIHVLCGFDDRNVLYYFMAGIDEARLELQPGIMNFYFTLTHAMEHGYRRFDFLRGAERYKYDLGAKPRKRFRVIIVPAASETMYKAVRQLRRLRQRLPK
jgi:CelD/BcsL family acetyltransferase involved in cellulose biosynthesis